MPPRESNAGCLVAMCGKDCVAIATDHRCGGSHCCSMNLSFQKVFKMGPRMFLGLTGVQLDILTVRDRAINYQHLNEDMSAQELSVMLSNFLFEHQEDPYKVEPVVAALDPKTLKPYICQMDMIGYKYEPQDFVVAGTCDSQLYGLCSSLWEPDLGPEDLFQVICSAILRAFDRDPSNQLGSTALVYLIEKNIITERAVKLP